MPDLLWNATYWGKRYTWPDEGDEWSAAWGGSEPQWFGSLYPRLHRFLPTGRILEIAPGFGRWTRFLIPAARSYLGIDLSEKCVEACKARFSGSSAEFVKNDGLSLEAAQNGDFDLIFSFDSLVHAEINVLEIYIPQIIAKLNKNGVAFIHHSNLGNFGNSLGSVHDRAQSVSRESVERLINQNGGKVLVQEIINWAETPPHDCLSMFCRVEDFPDMKPTHLYNTRFMEEAAIIKEFQKTYSGVYREGVLAPHVVPYQPTRYNQPTRHMKWWVGELPYRLQKFILNWISQARGRG